MRVAVLDDYQEVAREMAEWASLPEGTEVRFFHDHLVDEDQLADRLRTFQVVVAMRERTPFGRSDVLTIHLVLSERTRGLVAASELAAMKPSARLVNTSRGPIVDEAALVESLRQGRIAGAALDVYDVEPLPADHPLRALPNV